MPGTISSVLAIDAGNTRIKWGVHDGARWAATGSVATAGAARLAEAFADAPAAPHAIASNVAGPGVATALENACSRRGATLRFIRSEAQQAGVTNGYREPAQLGPDRWASLIAAHAMGGGHKLVVNAGTALTIDALTAEGRFLGGLIVPGPALMRRSLDRGTAGLRLTEGEFHDFPRATPDAITSGAIQAGAGAVARLREDMAKGGPAPALIVLSGGAAAELAPHLPIAFEVRENLVLDGLVLIAARG